MSLARDDQPLFIGGHLDEALRSAETSMKREVDAYDENKLLNTPAEDLASYFAEKFRVEPIELRENEISTDQTETTLDTRRIPDGRFMYGDHQPQIAASAVSFFVPFDGDPQLFKLRPNSFTLSPPRAAIREREREMVLTFTTHAPDAVRIKQEFNNQLGQVKNYLMAQRSQVDAFNKGLPGTARACIDTRRQRLLQARNTVGELGYPMRRRDGLPTTYAAPTVRRKIVPSPPPASTAPYKPEPALAMAEYEHILSIIQSMAVVLERSPTAFTTMGEEDLRQHFLVQLNGHYEGTATGETFNVGGKTDILVREGGKNIFIAECKFWRGPAGFTETIDQLLGYTSWRDTKTAIILFNRDTTFSTVLAKVPEVVKAHPNFKREVPVDDETRFRAHLCHKNDRSRELVVTVLAFDVPK